MKNQFAILSIFVCIISCSVSTVFAQHKENKSNKKESHLRSKDHDKPKSTGRSHEGENKGNTSRTGRIERNRNHRKNGLKATKSAYKYKQNHGKKNENNSADVTGHHMNYGYFWNRETFKDRQKIKNGEKVSLCHKLGVDEQPRVNIKVSPNAVKAHLKHGDDIGSCPIVTTSRFSNTFLIKRNEYYNNIETSQEKVLYSRSIFDYAMERLTESRLQLVTLKSNHMPLADIKRKEATVVELEQNMSLLQTLIGYAAEFVVNKL